MPRYRRFYPIFERIDRRMITCKKITLCWAGAGRTIPASDRRPIGFAGDSRGVYFHCPSRSFDMAVEASFRSHGANQSQAGFWEPCLRGFDVRPRASSGANQGSRGACLVPGWKWSSGTGVQWTADRFCRQPSWGIPSFSKPDLASKARCQTCSATGLRRWVRRLMHRRQSTRSQITTVYEASRPAAGVVAFTPLCINF